MLINMAMTFIFSWMLWMCCEIWRWTLPPQTHRLFGEPLSSWISAETFAVLWCYCSMQYNILYIYIYVYSDLFTFTPLHSHEIHSQISAPMFHWCWQCNTICPPSWRLTTPLCPGGAGLRFAFSAGEVYKLWLVPMARLWCHHHRRHSNSGVHSCQSLGWSYRTFSHRTLTLGLQPVDMRNFRFMYMTVNVCNVVYKKMERFQLRCHCILPIKTPTMEFLFFWVLWRQTITDQYRSCNLWIAHDVDQCRSMGDPTWSDFAKRWWLPGVEQGISTDSWTKKTALKTCGVPLNRTIPIHMCSGNKPLAATGLEFTKIGSRCLMICVATVCHLFFGRSKKPSVGFARGVHTGTTERTSLEGVYLIVLEII